MRFTGLLMIAALGLGTSGCWFAKKTPPVLPIPQTPVPLAPAPAPAEPPELPRTSRPPIVPDVELEPEEPEEPEPKEPLPTKPTVRRRPSSTPPAPATPPPATPQPPPATAPEPTPQLEEILSADRRKQYEAEFSDGIARANEALKQAATKTLDKNQQETEARVRTFLAQATAAKEKDISTALQLARRADLLGQELLKSLR